MITKNILKMATLILVTQQALNAEPERKEIVKVHGVHQIRHVGPESRNIKNVGPTYLSNEEVKDVSIVGPAQLNDIGARSLDVKGTLTFKSLVVADNATIMGPVEKSSRGQFGSFKAIGPVDVSDMHCNKLSITGPAHLVRAHVTGHSTFAGPLKAEGCMFKTVTITADEIELKDTHTTAIVIKKNNTEKKSGFLAWVGKKSNPGTRLLCWVFGFFGYKNVPHTHARSLHSEVLTLSGQSKIGGDITFESKRGHVILMPGALVTGTITGGTIEKR